MNDSQITFFQICRNLDIPGTKNLLEAIEVSNISNLLKERTNEVLALGAFGLPWLTLKRNTLEDEEEVG